MPRLLAFTDPHGEIEAVRAIVKLAAVEKPDLIVCSGDLTLFGHRHALFFRTLATLKQPIYFIPGNHDDQTTTAKISKEWPFMIDVSWRVVEAAGFLITGVPGNDLSFWPGRSRGEDDAVKTVQHIVHLNRSGKPLIFLAHYPPSECEEVDGSIESTPDAGGSSAVRSITEKLSPALVVSGHYHACFNQADRLGITPIVNPGPRGTIVEL